MTWLNLPGTQSNAHAIIKIYARILRALLEILVEDVLILLQAQTRLVLPELGKLTLLVRFEGPL